MLLDSTSALQFLTNVQELELVKQQVGIDLTVESIKIVSNSGASISRFKTELPDYKLIERKTKWLINPGETYSITFREGIKLPADVAAFVHSRSSLVRSGAFIMSGVFDPGFQTENIGSMLFAFRPILIEKDARLAQMIFYRLAETVANPYNGQFQGDKDVK